MTLTRGLLSAFLGIFLIGGRAWQEKVQPQQVSFIKKSISNINQHPELGAEFSEAIDFRLDSRKSIYRLGELMSLDLAMLNKSEESVFTRIPKVPNLYLQRVGGEEKVVIPYHIIDQAVVPELFSQLKKNWMVSQSILLLLGCQKDEHRQNSSSETEQDDKKAFERGSFVNQGQACLPIEKLGEYIITVEVSNYFVIVSPSEQAIKTTVGKLRSASLRITIEK